MVGRVRALENPSSDLGINANCAWPWANDLRSDVVSHFEKK